MLYNDNKFDRHNPEGPPPTTTIGTSITSLLEAVDDNAHRATYTLVVVGEDWPIAAVRHLPIHAALILLKFSSCYENRRAVTLYVWLLCISVIVKLSTSSLFTIVDGRST